MIYHGDNGLKDLAAEVMSAALSLAAYRYDYDAIAVTGISGLSVGAPLSLITNKKLVVIRKESETAHSSAHPGMTELKDGDRYIFVDDFISSGATAKRVRSAIEREVPGAKYVGSYTTSSNVANIDVLNAYS